MVNMEKIFIRDNRVLLRTDMEREKQFILRQNRMRHFWVHCFQNMYRKLGIKVLKTSAGVQAALRKNETEQYLFLINYSAEQQKVELGGKLRNILSNEEEYIAMLIPGDYAIYRL